MGAATVAAAVNDHHRAMVGPITVIVLVLAGAIILSVAWEEFKRRR
jgi:hypothetical protein